MSKIKKDRLRSHLVKIILLSMAISSMVLVLLMNLLSVLNDNGRYVNMTQVFVLMNEYSEHQAKRISNEVSDIRDISHWNGWSSLSEDWIVEIYDGDNKLIFTKGETDTIYTSTISVTQSIENLDGAYLLMKTNMDSQQKYPQSLPMFLSMITFFFVFSLLFKRVEKYTHEIADGISLLAGGDMDYRLEVRGNNELSVISANINALADALNAQKIQSKKSDYARDLLIINMAHDVKTPVTVLEGYLTILLSEETISQQQRDEYLQIALDRCVDLNDRIDKLFEYTRLSSKQETLNIKSVGAKAYISQRFEEFVMVLNSEGFTYESEVTIYQSHKISIDIHKMQRVFDNLLSNILKYADRSKAVILKAEVRVDKIVVKIKNTCNEIPEIDAERLFDRLVTGDKSRNSKSAGLGLSICKVIMEMHKGKIEAEISDNEIEFMLTFIKED